MFHLDDLTKSTIKLQLPRTAEDQKQFEAVDIKKIAVEFTQYIYLNCVIKSLEIKPCELVSRIRDVEALKPSLRCN